MVLFKGSRSLARKIKCKRAQAEKATVSLMEEGKEAKERRDRALGDLGNGSEGYGRRRIVL